MIIFFLNFGKCQQGGTVERAMLWFKCAAVHDPVRPVLKNPAVIGWEAKQRRVDLVIQRSIKGEELQLKVLDGYDLVVEVPNKSELEAVSQKLTDAFGEEAWLEPITKTLLV
jgi:hypothetical protein